MKAITYHKVKKEVCSCILYDRLMMRPIQWNQIMWNQHYVYAA